MVPASAARSRPAAVRSPRETVWPVRRSTSSSTSCRATAIRARLSTRQTRPGAKALNNDHETSASYSPYYDFNGAGIINSTDAGDFHGGREHERSRALPRPTAPSPRGGVSTTGAAGTSFTALALSVQETGSSTSLTTGSSQTSGAQAQPAPRNVVSASTTAAATTSTSAASTLGSGSGSMGSAVVASTTNDRGQHGRHQFAAVDAAVSQFDLADLWV